MRRVVEEFAAEPVAPEAIYDQPGDVYAPCALGATIKMAEMMVDLRRSSGLSPARRGYFVEKPPRDRVKELIALYGMNHLMPTSR